MNEEMNTIADGIYLHFSDHEGREKEVTGMGYITNVILQTAQNGHRTAVFRMTKEQAKNFAHAITEVT